MVNETEQGNDAQWIDDHMAALHGSPECQPDVERRLRQAQDKHYRRKQRRWRVAWTALSVAVSLVIVLSFPSSRLRAQQLFQRVS